MDHLQEAKANFHELASFFNTISSCATYVRNELSRMVSLLGRHENAERLIETVIEEKGGEEFCLPSLSLPAFLQFERNLLCVADGVLFQIDLREFEMAVALEGIRQHALLPLIKLSEDVQRYMAINEKSPELRKHTPRGF